MEENELKRRIILISASLLLILLLVIGRAWLTGRTTTTRASNTIENREHVMREILKVQNDIFKKQSVYDKEIYRYYSQLVSMDSNNTVDLISYSGSSVRMLYSANDSSEKRRYTDSAIWSANRTRRLDNHSYASLSSAAITFMSCGRYDVADSIYNRIISLIDNDSLSIPQPYAAVKDEWLKELKEAVHDNKTLIILHKKQSQRKYYKG
ncbi:MAG: hypothetical protein MUF78_05735 [Candidatus Edwardsbacteria bacterium]|nr:hypothetical protein [Candidatus Edwardsbacteria bacterium]